MTDPTHELDIATAGRIARDFFNRQHILMLNDAFWDEPKRLRHKMAIQWARAGARVLWIERPPRYSRRMFRANEWSALGRPSLREIEPNLWVGAVPIAPPGSMIIHHAVGRLIRPLYLRLLRTRIRTYLERLDLRPTLTVLFQQAALYPIVDDFPDSVFVYYSMDVYGYFRQSSESDAIERTCSARADINFSTSDRQRERLAHGGKPAYTLPHAVDHTWWEGAPAEDPYAPLGIAEPRIVFTGPIRNQIDFDLLLHLARALPDCQFVFVGPVLQDSLEAPEVEALRSRPNCHLLGGKPPEALPPYIRHATILMLPYIPTDMTRYVGLPLKFFEYCISGRPIVSTPFSDIGDPYRRALYIHDSPREWEERIRTLLEDPGRDRDAGHFRRNLALKNTYAHRLAEQARLISDL